MATIKAIETVYNGYRFRSRLEARWAVFFDTLGIEYQYEPEGFDIDGIWYLPDFWLPKQNLWVEIKAENPLKNAFENDDHECMIKASLLAQGTKFPVLVNWGEIDYEHNRGVTFFALPEKNSFRFFNSCYFTVCPRCNEYCLQLNMAINAQGECYLGEGLYIPTGIQGIYCAHCKDILVEQKIYFSHLANKTKHAYTAARQARFERGK